MSSDGLPGDMERRSSSDLPAVATLGTFILDSFKYEDDYRETQLPVLEPGRWYIGGGGTYATIGARMWLPPDRIKMIIHKGLDFPAHIAEQLQSYSPSLFTFLADPAHPQTMRSLITYSNNQRHFVNLTPKREIELSEIYDGSSSGPPDYVHVICSPMRLSEILGERAASYPDWSPKWIWEPNPGSCNAENLAQMLKLAGAVAVLSPNDLEASELLGCAAPPQSPEEIAKIGRYFHRAGFETVIIRAGRRGSFVIGSARDDTVAGTWVPALIEDQTQVVDPTGAGNAFLGGLMAGLASGESLLGAASFGSVSAGLTITQPGLPKITENYNGEPTRERWNDGVSPRQLADQLRQRMRSSSWSTTTHTPLQ